MALSHRESNSRPKRLAIHLPLCRQQTATKWQNGTQVAKARCLFKQSRTCGSTQDGSTSTCSPWTSNNILACPVFLACCTLSLALCSQRQQACLLPLGRAPSLTMQSFPRPAPWEPLFSLLTPLLGSLP